MKKMQDTVISLSTGSKKGQVAIWNSPNRLDLAEAFEQSLGKVREWTTRMDT